MFHHGNAYHRVRYLVNLVFTAPVKQCLLVNKIYKPHSPRYIHHKLYVSSNGKTWENCQVYGSDSQQQLEVLLDEECFGATDLQGRCPPLRGCGTQGGDGKPRWVKMKRSFCSFLGCQTRPTLWISLADFGWMNITTCLCRTFVVVLVVVSLLTLW